MKLKKVLGILGISFMMILATGCDSLQGGGFDDIDGNSQTPYIGSNGNWWLGDTDTGVQAAGKDGLTPTIGSNGNWYLNGIDTGVPAKGSDGITPTIGPNGNWWVGSFDTGVSASGKKGDNGITPTIGTNGNWWIGSFDTGVSAAGKKGDNGKTPYIGPNDNWWIDGIDTGVPAKGSDGTGESAYDLFKKYNPDYEGTEEEWIAQFTSNKTLCTVTFDPNNGNEKFTNQVYSGTNVPKPEDPTSEGLYFKGWYDENNERWNFLGNSVSKDLTLTAKYQKTPVGENLVEPQVSIINVSSTTTSIKFDIFETDVDNVCVMDKAELYLNNELKATITDFSNKEFTDLLSDNEYTIKLTYEYDLNDGNTTQIRNIVYNKKTEAKTEGIVSFTTVDSTASSISFDYELVDNDETITINNYEIYKDDALVKTITDLDDKSFTELLSNAQYQVKINYIVDLNNGTDQVKKSVVVDKNTVKVNEPTVSITNLVATTSTIAFNIEKEDPDSVLVLESIDASKNGDILQTITDFTKPLFTELLTNSRYDLTLHYHYNLGDGTGVISKEVTALKYTLAEPTPSVRFRDVVATKNSISFGLLIADPNTKATIESVDLYKSGVLVGSITDITGNNKFEGLLSGFEYELYVNYSYDLNDGNGVINKSYNTGIKTIELNKPIISFSNVVLTTSTIDCDIVLRDFDNITTINSIELYDQDKLLQTNTNENTLANKISFAGFTKTNTITINISYSYDLNDGNGVVTEVKKITPYNSISNIFVANTSAVSYGETIVIQADVVNFENASFVGVVVDGVEYPVDPASTSTRLICNIKNNGQFVGGQTLLTVDKITTTGLDIVPAENNVLSLYINPSISITSIEMVDKDFKSAKYFTRENMVLYNGKYVPIVLFHLDNVGGYSFDNAVMNTNTSSNNKYSNIIRIDDNTWYTYANFVSNENSGIYDYVHISTFTYSSDSMTKTINTDFSTNKYIYMPKEIIHISTKEDLKAIRNNYANYYVLDNDIDLEGEEWEALPSINGVFEGNGHTIYNMKIVKTFASQNVYLGLFKSYSGYINNLTLSDIVVSIDLTSDNSNSYSVYYGGFVADSYYGVNIYNCHVVNSIVSINNYTSGTNYVGGIIGYSYSAILDEVSNDTNISTNSGYAGGIVGGSDNSYASYTSYTITNTINYGNVVACSTNGYVSGIVGIMYYNYPTIIMNNVINVGNISGGQKNDSFINYNSSYIYGSNIEFNNCLNMSSSSFKIESSYNNCYSTTNTELLDDADYYINTLNMDIDIWDLSYLNYNSGYYPKLKNDINYSNGTETIAPVVYTFNTNNGSSVDEITTVVLFNLPETKRDDYFFGGWYLDSTLTGDMVEPGFYSPVDVTLYAKWYTFEDLAKKQKSELTILNGVIVSAGSCKDSVLCLDLPVGSSAFSNNTYIKEIVIGSGCTSIDSSAFEKVMTLNSIRVNGEGLTSIGDNAFSGCLNLRELELPSSVTIISSYAFNSCSSLEKVDLSNTRISYINNNCFSYCYALKDVKLPTTVAEIYDYAFCGCSKLENINLSGVTFISYQTFYNCSSLTNVDLSSVTSISGHAFENCSSLTNVDLSSLTSISQYAFENCSSLTNVDLSSLTSISEHAFSNCSSLKTVILSKSVSDIYSSAFAGCTSLTDVYYLGTKDLFNNISIYGGNTNLTVANIHYYSKVKPTDTENLYWFYLNGAIYEWTEDSQITSEYFMAKNTSEIADYVENNPFPQSELGSFFTLNGDAVYKIASGLGVISFKLPEEGISFTSSGESYLEVSLSSTGSANVSLFKLVGNDGTVYVPDGYDGFGTTAMNYTPAKVEGNVTGIYGTRFTTLTFSDLPAGTYTMKYVSGTYNNEAIERGGRFISIYLLSE